MSWAIAIAVVLALPAPAFAQITAEVLPHLGRGGEAFAISADGSVIVGYVRGTDAPNFRPKACRWVNGVLEMLPWPGNFSVAGSVSAAGDVSVGYFGTTSGLNSAVRAEGLGSPTVLPSPPATGSIEPGKISRDGSTIPGSVATGAPAIWSGAGTAVTLLERGGFGRDYAVAASAGGALVVGQARNADGFYRPTRWISGALSTLPSLNNRGGAADVTPNGSIIVGSVDGSPGVSQLPARWTAGVLGLLETPNPRPTYANSVSADGNLIVGAANDPAAPASYIPVCWIGGAYRALPYPAESNGGGQAHGVSDSGNAVVGWTFVSATGRALPTVWHVCPNALQGGQCDAPPHATNLPFEGRVVTDPDHPIDFTLQIVDDTPSQTVTIELDPSDVAALTGAGYLVQVTQGANPASVRIWQKTSLDLGWAEREWRLRINASDNAQSVANPIELFVHRRSALPPRRLLDGHPSTLTPLAQGDPRWGSQRTGATDDTASPTLDLIRDWVAAVRAELAPIPLEDAGAPVADAIVRQRFTDRFRTDPAYWLDQPVLVANELTLTNAGSGGQKAETLHENVQLQYVSGAHATEYPRADITTRAGVVTAVALRPLARGSGFEASSGTVLTAAPAAIGDVVGFTCTVTATTSAPNGVRGDKNDLLEIVRQVEQKRPNNNLRLIGCCLSSCVMAVNAVTTGELPQAAHEFTPGEAHSGMRSPDLAWMSRPGAGQSLELDRWRGSPTGNAVPGQGPRFVNGFCLEWNEAQRWFNSQGASVKIVRWSPPVTEASVREQLDNRRAMVFFNGEHWRMASKYDFGGAGGALRIFVSDPGNGSQQWLTLAEAGGTNLKSFATVELVSGSQQFSAQATDLLASAPGVARILVTDSNGRKAGIDPATGQVFDDGVAGISYDSPLDFPGYAPLSDAEWEIRIAESLRRVTMAGAVPVGTYVIDVDRADTTVTVAWRQSGQPVHIESFQPVAAPWGGRVVMQVTTVGSCPADLNGDQVVNSQDVAILLNAWGGTGAADLDGNGVVGSADVAILLNAWGACGG